MMLVRALLRDHCLDEDAEAVPVATAFGLYEVEQQVCARHLPLPKASFTRQCCDPIVGGAKATAPRRHHGCPHLAVSDAESSEERKSPPHDHSCGRAPRSRDREFTSPASPDR